MWQCNLNTRSETVKYLCVHCFYSLLKRSFACLNVFPTPAPQNHIFKGANTNTRRSLHWTPLMAAIKECHVPAAGVSPSCKPSSYEIIVNMVPVSMKNDIEITDNHWETLHLLFPGPHCPRD